MFKAFHLIFLIFYVSNASGFFNDTFAAGELLYKIVQKFKAIPPTTLDKDLYSEAVEQINVFQNELQELRNYVPMKSERLEALPVNTTDEIKRIKGEEKIQTIISSINYRFNDFTDLLQQDQKNVRWSVFVNVFLLHLQEWMETLHSMITPLKTIDLWDEGLFHLLAHRTGDHRSCGEAHKVQDFMIELYKKVVLMEIKVTLALAFSDAYQDDALNPVQMRQYHKDFVAVLNDQLLAYTKALSSSLETLNSPYFEYCDASYNSWIKDVSSFELTQLFQQVAFWYSTPFCSYSCQDIWNKRSCKRDWFDQRSGCPDGLVSSCEYLSEVSGCKLANGARKYKWLHSSSLGQFGGDSRDCSDGEIFDTPWAKAGCHCKCIGFQWKVYVGPFESKKRDNYVITGVRFTHKKYGPNNIIFLQPAEGKLEANGHIADYKWIDLPTDISSDNIASLELSWSIFFLDDLQIESQHVLTGIQLKKSRRKMNTETLRGFAITISGHFFNYKTGKLDVRSVAQRRETAPVTGIQRELVYKRVRPRDTDIFKRLNASSSDFNYVKIQQSDLIDDYGQSTVPLFDSTPVVMKRHSPLSGIAIIHKGSKDNAGFISVRIRPVSYLPYLGELTKIYQENATKWDEYL